jgi:hypothetical protein
METKIEKQAPISYGERFVMTFIMMSVTKNLPKIDLILLKMSDPNAFVIKQCLTLKTTGNASMAGCTTTDTQVHTAANTLQTYETGANLNPKLYTTSQVNQQKKIAIDLYNKVINFMKGACNDLAVAAGDVNAGHTLANNCGATIAKPKGGDNQPDFGITESGPGWFLVHAKKATTGVEGHIFLCAIVAAKDIVPGSTACKYFVDLEGTIQITDLPSQQVLAINHATILPANHKAATPATPIIKMKKTTKLSVSKKKHPVFSYTSPDPYTWDGWIWETIQ